MFESPSGDQYKEPSVGVEADGGMGFEGVPGLDSRHWSVKVGGLAVASGRSPRVLATVALVGLLLVVVVAFVSSDDVEQHDRSGAVAGRAPPASSRTGAQLLDGADAWAAAAATAVSLSGFSCGRHLTANDRCLTLQPQPLNGRPHWATASEPQWHLYYWPSGFWEVNTECDDATSEVYFDSPIGFHALPLPGESAWKEYCGPADSYDSAMEDDITLSITTSCALSTTECASLAGVTAALPMCSGGGVSSSDNSSVAAECPVVCAEPWLAAAAQCDGERKKAFDAAAPPGMTTACAAVVSTALATVPSELTLTGLTCRAVANAEYTLQARLLNGRALYATRATTVNGDADAFLLHWTHSSERTGGGPGWLVTERRTGQVVAAMISPSSLPPIGNNHDDEGGGAVWLEFCDRRPRNARLLLRAAGPSGGDGEERPIGAVVLDETYVLQAGRMHDFTFAAESGTRFEVSVRVGTGSGRASRCLGNAFDDFHGQGECERLILAGKQSCAADLCASCGVSAHFCDNACGFLCQEDSVSHTNLWLLPPGAKPVLVSSFLPICLVLVSSPS